MSSSGMSLVNPLNLVSLRMPLTEIGWQNCSDLRGILLLLVITKLGSVISQFSLGNNLLMLVTLAAPSPRVN